MQHTDTEQTGRFEIPRPIGDRHALPGARELTTISQGKQLILTVSNVLSPAECASMIERTEARGFGDAPITTPGGFVMRPDIRNNTRVMYDDFDLAAELWRRVEPFVPMVMGAYSALGLNERLRFYRYDLGQYFRWHFDGAFRRSRTERSLLTAMVYLNDGFAGGATEFEITDAGEPVSIVPERGMALIFAHAQRHQGAPIYSGRKYVLRSDVMYRRSET